MQVNQVAFVCIWMYTIGIKLLIYMPQFLWSLIPSVQCKTLITVALSKFVCNMWCFKRELDWLRFMKQWLIPYSISWNEGQFARPGTSQVEGTKMECSGRMEPVFKLLSWTECVPPNSYVETLNPSETVLGGGPLGGD